MRRTCSVLFEEANLTVKRVSDFSVELTNVRKTRRNPETLKIRISHSFWGLLLVRYPGVGKRAIYLTGGHSAHTLAIPSALEKFKVSIVVKTVPFLKRKESVPTWFLGSIGGAVDESDILNELIRDEIDIDPPPATWKTGGRDLSLSSSFLRRKMWKMPDAW